MVHKFTRFVSSKLRFISPIGTGFLLLHFRHVILFYRLPASNNCTAVLNMSGLQLFKDNLRHTITSLFMQNEKSAKTCFVIAF